MNGGRKYAPDLAHVGLDPTAVNARHTEAFHGDALGIQHAEHVVIGDQQQAGRIRETFVLGKPARVGVSVRADDRQVFDAFVKTTGDLAGVRVNGK